MQSFLQDIRFALRQFRKSPGFTATAIISLALGIAATTAVFSVVRAVLLDPYPYANSDRMVHLVVKPKTGDRDRNFINLTGPQLKQFREAKAIESLGAFDSWNLSTSGTELPEDVAAVYFTSNAFNHFGVPAMLGRGLIPSDAPDGQDPQPVVVLGYLFWQRHYNGDPSVVGRTLQLVHKNYTIVGVTPPRFAWGDGDVYLPLKLTNDPSRSYFPVIKLKPGVSHAAANAEFQPLLEEFAKETPSHFPAGGFRMNIEGLNDQFVKDIGGSLYLLFAAVALLLLDRLRQRIDSVAGPRHRPRARNCRALGGGRQPLPHSAPIVDRIAVAVGGRRRPGCVAGLSHPGTDRRLAAGVLLPSRSRHQNQSAGAVCSA